MNVYDELKERGFVAQVSDEAAVRAMLAEKRVTFYVGFDTTASSLHAGSLVPIMAMMHLRRAGHRAIGLVGSGTTMVGDPSGKTEMRQMLDEETIRGFGRAIHAQLGRYLHFDGQGAIALDNADWLLPLRYVAFLRDIGRHFSVNRMLAAEAYKQRLERGLSFIEFNYQLLQAYDYLTLFRSQGCTLQMGGDDQWGNILAGVDLIRRHQRGQADPGLRGDPHHPRRPGRGGGPGGRRGGVRRGGGEGRRIPADDLGRAGAAGGGHPAGRALRRGRADPLARRGQAPDQAGRPLRERGADRQPGAGPHPAGRGSGRDDAPGRQEEGPPHRFLLKR